MTRTAFMDFDAGDPCEIIRIRPACGATKYNRLHYAKCSECRRRFILDGVSCYYKVKKLTPETYAEFAESIYDAPRWHFNSPLQ
jgi:hypothetical protein